MPNWSDPAEIQKDGDVFTKLMFSLFGVYVWELFITSGFEWSLITGKRKFKWPMVVFFFLCRYCILWALIGLCVLSIYSLLILDQALYTFNSWCGNMTILSASTSLMLRTVALWERRWKIVVPVGILSLGQWALLWYGMFIVKAEWVPSANACVVVKNNHVFLNIVFFYTMAFDCIILLLTTAALMRQTSRSGLWDLLFRDGLVYFLVTFTCNCLPAVLNVLNLNVIMDVVATVSAPGVSTPFRR
ncbi:hypothetical protein JAAARDRAFT_116772 [Jaapia argillacea MUCL 33604]|uniref:Uncharacterized protein n=1 Tax=Jaapia argillacea MUCL 33604 TaxID=933084 RepID=A0A067QCM0_9AGAM|nr:hypothetical protein JAAARDRAFT_116772 [Jaapia argillacea MUCL 33604]